MSTKMNFVSAVFLILFAPEGKYVPFNLAKDGCQKFSRLF